jgi:glycine hydroxymethyltransferase
LPGDIKAGRHYMHPGGVRIGVPEVTRLGMKAGEMKDIAKFIKRVVVDKEDTKKVNKDVASFRKEFQKVQYAFDNAVGAYEYISLVSGKRK